MALKATFVLIALKQFSSELGTKTDKKAWNVGIVEYLHFTLFYGVKKLKTVDKLGNFGAVVF